MIKLKGGAKTVPEAVERSTYVHLCMHKATIINKMSCSWPSFYPIDGTYIYMSGLRCEVRISACDILLSFVCAEACCGIAAMNVVLPDQTKRLSVF